jgi:hypothetical protein
MPRKPRVDTEEIRAFLRRLPNKDVYRLLDRAVDLLPATRLAKFLEGYVDPEELRATSARSSRLLDAVKGFHEDSLSGEYYEAFDVNSKNFMDESRGTAAWITECNRLVERSVALSDSGDHKQASECFDLILALLRHIDECRDDIIFFADEGGSWQVGVDWRAVLPAYFQSLAATSEPKEFAEHSINTIEDFAEYDRNRHLRDARRHASPAQKKALKELT